MHGVARHDGIRNEYIRRKLEIPPMEKKIKESFLMVWQVHRRSEVVPVQCVKGLQVQGTRTLEDGKGQ